MKLGGGIGPNGLSHMCHQETFRGILNSQSNRKITVGTSLWSREAKREECTMTIVERTSHSEVGWNTMMYIILCQKQYYKLLCLKEKRACQNKDRVGNWRETGIIGG